MINAQEALIRPLVDSDSEPWWAGLRRSVIVLQRCTACARHRCPPLPSCPYCGNPDSIVEESSGRGRIYSWVVVRRALAPEFVGEEPYTIVTVQLDEGPRLFGRLLGGEPASDLPVGAAFYEVGDTVLLGFAAEHDGP
jgi:uncharacterized OB-fold protein